MLATLIDPRAADAAMDRAREVARQSPWSPASLSAIDKRFALRQEAYEARLTRRTGQHRSPPGADQVEIPFLW